MVSTIVIGAGPYGLSVAAWLKAAGIRTLVLGRPMEFWQGMPHGMFLKSPWSASSLSDPDGAFSLDRYVNTGLRDRLEPIPLPLFLDYGRWFLQGVAPDIDPTHVRNLRRDGSGFRIELTDGRCLEANRVVVAVGIRAFADLPKFSVGVPSAIASHTITHTNFSSFAGRRVAVVGTGQSGLESAALLHESGAQVEVICRGPVAWVNRKLYDSPAAVRRIFYPPSDVGPPGINWIVAFPLLVRLLPEPVRTALYKRAIRPAGAKWLRQRVEGRVQLTPNTFIAKATRCENSIRLELSDGSVREVDHLFFGTGFRPDLRKLTFLDQALLDKIDQRVGLPVLNRWFESSVPNLHFVGGVASHNFGALCNFVAGAKVPARQIARRAANRS